MVDMEIVSSSTIEAIGYDAEGQELHVRFSKSGKTYVYRGFPDSLYQDFVLAPSKGQFHNENIKKVFTDFYTL